MKRWNDTRPCIIAADAALPAQRKAWARQRQKIYEVDPLTCPQCMGAMTIISFTGQPEAVKQLPLNLGLWQAQWQPPPKITSPPAPYSAVAEHNPSYDNADPDYTFEANM